MKRNGALGQAVVTENRHLLVLVLFRHWYGFYIGIILGFHFFLVNYGGSADWAFIGRLYVFLEALLVHGMVTLHEHNIIQGMMHIFQAHRTIISNTNTLMIVRHHFKHATVAAIAVNHLMASAVSADATFVAVELLPFRNVIVPKITDAAEINSKLNLAAFTILLRLLNGMAFQALDLLQLGPIH